MPKASYKASYKCTFTFRSLKESIVLSVRITAGTDARVGVIQSTTFRGWPPQGEYSWVIFSCWCHILLFDLWKKLNHRKCSTWLLSRWPHSLGIMKVSTWSTDKPPFTTTVKELLLSPLNGFVAGLVFRSNQTLYAHGISGFKPVGACGRYYLSG